MSTPIPCIIAALDDELRIIRSRMAIDAREHLRPALFLRGIYRGQPLLLVRSGIGAPAMARAMAHLLEHRRPQRCLHVGYCGGLDPHFAAGDLLVARETVSAADGARHPLDAVGAERLLGCLKERGQRVRAGTLVTAQRAIGSSHEKAFVGTQHAAQGVDMESAAAARACREQGVPLTIVRAVLDPMDVELPDLEDILDRSGAPMAGALMGHLVKHPRDILKLPRIQYLASQARAAIAAAIDAWIDLEGGRA